MISRTSAMTYRERRKTVPEIAHELKVDAVIEGSVQRVGERVRVNLNLIDARSDRSLWTEIYERDFEELVALENEVARTIANRIATTLTPEERTHVAEAPRVDSKVYESYLKGRYFWNRRTEADTRRAVDLFEEAIRFDRDYAPAYAGLADAYGQIANYG